VGPNNITLPTYLLIIGSSSAKAAKIKVVPYEWATKSIFSAPVTLATNSKKAGKSFSAISYQPNYQYSLSISGSYLTWCLEYLVPLLLGIQTS